MWIGGEGGIRTHGVTTPLLSTTSRLAEAHFEVEVIESCWPLRLGAFGWVPRDVAGQTQRDRCLLAVNCKGTSIFGR
jgi:hypothetical protein